MSKYRNNLGLREQAPVRMWKESESAIIDSPTFPVI
jgi:hypothetical protein